MYTVLIVDDIQAVCQGLTELIPWEEYGFIVEGYALNGKFALEQYQRMTLIAELQKEENTLRISRVL